MKLKVLILSDDVSNGLRIFNEISPFDTGRACRVDILVSNNHSTAISFCVNQLVQIIKFNLFFSVIKLILARRIYFSLRHSSSYCKHIVRRKYDIGLHAMGIIYKSNFINSFKIGILNSHIGDLPYYRGRNVAEWSLLHGHPNCITVFYIDSGIDTGRRIVYKESILLVRSQTFEQEKAKLFRMDAKMYGKALEIIVKSNVQSSLNQIELGHRYYEMSNLLSGVIQKGFLINEK